MSTNPPNTEDMPSEGSGPLAGRTSTAVLAPIDEEQAERDDRNRRRRVLVAVVVAAALLLVVGTAIVMAAGDGDDEGGASGSSTAPTTATTTVTSTEPTATGAPGATSPVETTAPAPSEIPTDPGDYTAAAFDAWQRGDMASLSQLATPPVVAFLTARSPEPDGWGDQQCEGAAGSSYCSWTRPDVELVLRVANEQADAGEPHAVHEAFFWAAPGRIAIWPFTTQAEADDTQAQVDQGHQPWLLDPAAVASTYARDELGWDDAIVSPLSPTGYEVTDPSSGAMAHVILTQPAHEGQGGIWAVTRAGSLSPGPGPGPRTPPG